MHRHDVSFLAKKTFLELSLQFQDLVPWPLHGEIVAVLFDVNVLVFQPEDSWVVVVSVGIPAANYAG